MDIESDDPATGFMFTSHLLAESGRGVADLAVDFAHAVPCLIMAVLAPVVYGLTLWTGRALQRWALAQAGPL